jgi:hypothetical protein
MREVLVRVEEGHVRRVAAAAPEEATRQGILL